MNKQNVHNLLELANLYPSPHNGQPIRIKQTGKDTFELYFEKIRGLQATNISYIFSFVSMGVFITHLDLSTQALGHNFTYELVLPKENDLHGNGTILFARCQVVWDAKEPDTKIREALRFRQTSRKKYYTGIDQTLSEDIKQTAGHARMSLNQLTSGQAKHAIWLNQRAVFDDMFDEPVRKELDHWLRYTSQQKQAKKDGLAYDCMELSGGVMKFIVDHPKILRAPGISCLLKQYYLRTMTDSSDVYYMLAPFASEKDSFTVGTVIMEIWKEISVQGYYLHPFGTIMSNHSAHKDFLKLANISHESRADSYLVFIFRCGKSEKPTLSLRIPYNEHLIME